jgi:aldehyde dehydrogenase (NAD+)
MASAAKQLARVSLELGGKSPGIVLDDAETAELIPQLLSGTTLMTGQACALLSRILVPRERYAEIVDAYASALSAVPFGDPNDPANLMGPLVSRTGYDRALDLIESARSEGARVVVGGGRPAEYPKGWYVEPTVIADVHNQMRIAREEVFGPVISFLPYDGEEDAVKIANDTDFGLAAAVFGRDRERAGRVAKRVRAGVVTVNGFALDPGIAFGGFKQSGIGREGGVAGMHTYTEVKALHLDAASEAAPLLR